MKFGARPSPSGRATTVKNVYIVGMDNFLINLKIGDKAKSVWKGNYRNRLPQSHSVEVKKNYSHAFLAKNFVKTTHLLKKSLKR